MTRPDGAALARRSPADQHPLVVRVIDTAPGPRRTPADGSRAADPHSEFHRLPGAARRGTRSGGSGGCCGGRCGRAGATSGRCGGESGR